ncbi:4'-phosphopantetheinyl transferase sfp [Kordia antarctica]|uniref:4'-phosphopantetheinyl transferase sfp n=1 Tax=Kordia antarctica TaxID=1218801 RepID=A0A7L4ZFW6_9FLAO|nr:4'-phosphopantetheinyl transferase superfamily protein [Kordia antarctica]QHI35389.1 4'-phosphopantetheinyl transferase sfp [Kordia antarctica]
MTHIYYTYISKENHDKLLQTYLSDFSENFQERILKYRRWEDAQLSLLGRLLLQHGLKTINQVHIEELLEYSAYGKPRLKDQKIKFNISHSGNIVICVLTDTSEVGIDIEKMHTVNIEDFKTQMTANEWQGIETTTNKTEAFFKYWTQKEAVVKANGKGFSIALNSFEIKEDQVDINGENFFLKEITLDTAYKCYIAFKDEIDNELELPKEIEIQL